MSEWVDFFVYAALIVTYWFVFATWGSRFTLAMVADRNPDWLADHPEFASQLDRQPLVPVVLLCLGRAEPRRALRVPDRCLAAGAFAIGA